MSLLSNRGRFSSSEKENNISKKVDTTSAISLIGKDPTKLFKIENKKKINSENDIKLRLQKANLSKNKNDSLVSEHQEYNRKVKQYIDDFDDQYSDNYNKKNTLNKKKKVSIKLIICMFVVETLTIIGIVAFGTFLRYANMTQNVTFNKNAVQNTNIDETTLAVMKGFKTVAIFGVDSRTGSVDKGNNSDVNLIANLNLETGDAQLVSIYRDLYLSITDQNTYDKLNAAYRKGGPEASVKAINKNFDLNITNFFSFNWKAVADGIELLGGVDLEITKSEYKYMNAFIHETCIATGIDAKNPAAHYIKSSGVQHLDGVQAVAYGRLRLMDSDFQRVERQKKVISLCLEKAKDLDIGTLRLIMEAVLPQIAYEFDMNEMLSILKIIKNINIVESCGVPDTNNVVSMDMGSSGDCVVPLSLEKAVVKLHKILFNADDYEPSTAVKRYSNRIIELRKMYAEENAVKASIKQSEEEESILAILYPTKAKKSTSSTTNKSVTKSSPSSIRSSNNNDDVVPIVDVIEYEEEPENDNIINSPPMNYTSKPTLINNNDNTNNTNNTNNTDNNNNSANNNNNSNNNNLNEEFGVRYDSPGGVRIDETVQPITQVPSGDGVIVSGPPTGNLNQEVNNIGNVAPIVVESPNGLPQVEGLVPN